MKSDEARVGLGQWPALVRASHPQPSAAVTAFAVILAAVAGNPALVCLAVGGAVLAGQLVIGWSNDLSDAARDRVSGRADKPLANGSLDADTLRRALLGAVAAVAVLSGLLGWRAGLANLWVVGWGVAYNLGLKSTVVSWLPYAAAFGTLPSVATLALETPRWPGGWAMIAGALLGISANLTNALPDLVDDERTGVRGLPHRLGPSRSLLLAASLLMLVTVLVVFGPAGGPRTVGWAGLVVVMTVVGVWLRAALRAPASRVTFAGLIGITAVDVVLLAATASGLR